MKSSSTLQFILFIDKSMYSAKLRKQLFNVSIAMNGPPEDSGTNDSRIHTCLLILVIKALKATFHECIPRIYIKGIKGPFYLDHISTINERMDGELFINISGSAEKIQIENKV